MTNPEATAISGTVLMTTMLACVLLARTEIWFPWLRLAIAVAGVAATALFIVVNRLPDVACRAVAVLALAACLAGPAAYSVATAMTPHTDVIPRAGPSGPTHANFGGFLDSPDPSPAVVAALRAAADMYTWAAAVTGSTMPPAISWPAARR